jgi:hypothetical protein
MRAFVITLSLAMIVAFLTGILVVFGGVRVNQTLLAMIGGGMFMIAVLFAAISAIGPKYRPTPALTPIMAGSSAAAVTAALILAANLHLTTSQAAAFRSSEPQRAAVPQAPERVPEARPVQPELPEPPADAFVAVPPAEESAGDIQAEDVPMDEAPADDPSVASALQPQATAPSGAVPIPLPVPRPRSPSETPEKLAPGETFTLSDQPFDSSTATAVPSPAPGAAPQATARITPPLPRSRPCGAGAPPCP